MDAPSYGRLVRVLSTKFDGSLHNDYVAQLLDAPVGEVNSSADAPLRLYVPGGTSIQSYRGELTVRVPFTALFWPGLECWWNVYHNHWTLPRSDQRWTPETYANVSLPASFDGETVRWVDLDLDVVVRAGVTELLDEDEFEEHRERWGYPERVARGALEAASQLMDLARSGAAPFDRESHITPAAH